MTHRVVATTVVRSPARPARVMGDTCRQVSWLAALAHRLRLPAEMPAVASGATLAAYSCGGSRGVGALRSTGRRSGGPRTAFPFHRRGPSGPRRDRHAG